MMGSFEMPAIRIETMTRFKGIKTLQCLDLLLTNHKLKQWPDLRGLRPIKNGLRLFIPIPILKQWPDLRGLRPSKNYHHPQCANNIETMTRFKGIKTLDYAIHHNFTVFIETMTRFKGIKTHDYAIHHNFTVFIETMTRFKGIKTLKLIFYFPFLIL